MQKEKEFVIPVIDVDYTCLTAVRNPKPLLPDCKSGRAITGTIAIK